MKQEKRSENRAILKLEKRKKDVQKQDLHGSDPRTNETKFYADSTAAEVQVPEFKKNENNSPRGHKEGRTRNVDYRLHKGVDQAIPEDKYPNKLSAADDHDPHGNWSAQVVVA